MVVVVGAEQLCVYAHAHALLAVGAMIDETCSNLLGLHTLVHSIRKLVK